MVCRQRTGGNLLIDFLITLFLIITILSDIIGWIIVFADYVKSGDMQYRRSLRHRLKDKSLLPMERDYIHLLLSEPWICIL